MLIRLISHFKKNPQHIDKLIVVKGLPDQWLFKKTQFGTELLSPWTPDIDVNIPKTIRELCEPMDITFRYPPVEKGRDWVTETRTILGVRLDYMSGPGRDMWDQIERYIEHLWPRTERLPEPRKVAPDQHLPFSLEVADIAIVDLRPPQVETRTVVAAPEAHFVPKEMPGTERLPSAFQCSDCEAGFEKKQALSMHRMKKHRGEKVGA